MFGGNSDYAYIGTFIGFLKQILSIFQRLFGGLDIDTGEPLNTTTKKAADPEEED